VNAVSPADSKKTASRRYFVRLLALASTTVFGIWFLAQACILAYIYFQKGGHFPLYITREDFIETALHGLAFVGSGILYAIFVHKGKAAPPQ
jgi:hypothetical protein